MFKYDRKRDAEYFDGSDVLIDEFLDAVQALGLDPDHLIHRRYGQIAIQGSGSGSYGQALKFKDEVPNSRDRLVFDRSGAKTQCGIEDFP